MRFAESIEINPEDYGHELTEDDMLVPTINSKDVIPDDFVLSCNCLNVRKKYLLRRVKAISCSKLCKCDSLRDLVPFVQFKKREKYPWKSVDFSKVAG